MKYYKDKDGNVYAYEEDGSQDDFIPQHLTKMTKKEVAALSNAISTETMQAEARAWRNVELIRSDVELSKVLDGMGTGTEKVWRDYRCALRNWPDSKSFPKTKPKAPDA